MDRQTELTKEQQYTAHVQQLLLAVVERSRDYSQGIWAPYARCWRTRGRSCA